MFILKNSYDDYLGSLETDHPPKKNYVLRNGKNTHT